MARFEELQRDNLRLQSSLAERDENMKKIENCLEIKNSELEQLKIHTSTLEQRFEQYKMAVECKIGDSNDSNKQMSDMIAELRKDNETLRQNARRDKEKFNNSEKQVQILSSQMKLHENQISELKINNKRISDESDLISKKNKLSVDRLEYSRKTLSLELERKKYFFCCFL